MKNPESSTHVRITLPPLPMETGMLEHDDSVAPFACSQGAGQLWRGMQVDGRTGR